MQAMTQTPLDDDCEQTCLEVNQTAWKIPDFLSLRPLSLGSLCFLSTLCVYEYI